MDPYAKMDNLLGSSLAERLRAFDGAGPIIATSLAENAALFSQWMDTHAVNGPEGIDAVWETEIARMEDVLSRAIPGDLSNESVLHDALAQLASAHPSREKARFLTSPAAEALLRSHPPAHLILHTGSHDVEGLFTKYRPLHVLALTRHTESADWQERYIEMLSRAQKTDFEIRGISYLAVDRIALSSAITAGGRVPKPWSMSHSKETGIIVAFTADVQQPIRTPKLVFSALFFHYSEETLRAARSVSRDNATGAHVAAIIKSTQRKLPFFNPNHHSEALYWEEGLHQLGSVFPELNVGAHIPYLSCGNNLAGSGGPVSLNLIDRIWDDNFSRSGQAYFHTNSPRFVYHFREALWTEILRKLRNMPRDEMANEIFALLDLDDVALTEVLLRKLHSN